MTQDNKTSNLSDKEILQAFLSIKRGTSSGVPALHKPLLLLFMLGQCWSNNERLHLFREIRYPLEELLNKFGGAKIHNDTAFLPFWHMRETSRDIWTLVGEKTLGNWAEKSSGQPRKRPQFKLVLDSALLGGFTFTVYRRLSNDKVMLLEVVFALLNKFFPEAMRLPLLQAVNIPSVSQAGSFHQDLFSIYKYSCSICQFPGTGNDESIDLQIGYFQPLAAGGPMDSKNCITLCDKHKNLLEHGAFTLAAQGDILVSERFRDLGGSQHLQLYDGKKATFPDTTADWPDVQYLNWHKDKIFNLAL